MIFGVHLFRSVRINSIARNSPVINAPLSEEKMKTGCRLGSDSHADTCCVNDHAYIETIVEGMTVDAIPFDESLGKVSNLSIVHAILAVDNMLDGHTHLIRLCNSIYVPHMNNCLLCPNQAREFGTIVDDVPIPLDHTGQSTFSLHTTDGTVFPFSKYGPTAYIHVRRPTQEELDHLPIIDITEEEEWDPYANESSISSVNISSVDTWRERLQVHIDAVSQGIYSGSSDYIYDYYEPCSEHLPEHVQRSIASTMTTKPKGSLTADYLAHIWHCGKETARKTIDATTCKHYRRKERGITQRFKPSRNFMRYRQITLPAGEFFTDTWKSKVKSIRGHKYSQVYGNKFGFLKCYPMETNTQGHLGETLSVFIQDVGVVQKLHTDNAPEMVGRKTPFFKKARKEGIDLTSIEPERPDENYGEILVRIVKLGSARLMLRRKVPMRLWCYAMEYFCELHTITVPGMYRNKGRTGYEIVFGFTPDISEYVEFEFYDYCWYWDTPQGYPHEKKHIGRWLGVAHRVGQAMVFWVMNANGKVIARSTVVPLEPAEYEVQEVKDRMSDLDKTITSKIGDYRNALHEDVTEVPDLDEDDLDAQLGFCFDLSGGELNGSNNDELQEDDIPESDGSSHEVDSSAFDKFLGIEVNIPATDGESTVIGKVTKRKRDHDNALIGQYNENPILNTALYQVETPDGNIHEYTANRIAEHVWNQVDDDGWDYNVLYDIIGHRKESDAVSKEDGYTTTTSGTRKRVITTKGWLIEVKWESGETSFVPLKIIKESNAAEVAEYAKRVGIDDEPAFAWWCRQALKQKEAMINKVCKRIRKRSKFGIAIPKDYEEAVILDRANRNTMWQDATKKEMSKVEVAFHFNEDGSIPIGFQKIACHLIYDVKFDLTRKARYVGGGHMTNVPAAQSYSSVVSRDSVRIMFLIAALNDLDIKMCDIGNSYLNAETRERVYFIAGPEWGSRAGMPVTIVRALYGLKSSGAEWKKSFASYIKHTLGYEPCVGSDDNVYLKAMKDKDGNEYYSYLVVYVDDVLCIHKDPDEVLRIINRDYALKEPPSAPDMYLGADFAKFEIFDEETNTVINTWSMSADSHIKKALEVVQARMIRDNVRFKSKKTAESPFTSQDYRPELDTSEPCNEDQVEFFQSLIGIARWLCELGRVDVLTETSLLSTCLANPRTGHLHQALHMFKYLKDHNSSKIVFDPRYANITDDHLPREQQADYKAMYMKELYPDAVEDIPKNAPKPLGRPVQISVFVDADHAGDKITRRSRTGILLYLNKAPILWYSKRQNTVETSTFGSEFVAMRLSFEMIKSMKYKLRMFGIPIDGPARVYGDNNAVILNSSSPESTLKKKHHSINYHYVRECVAAGIGLIFKVDTGSNLADLFTKVLDKVKRKKFVKMILR